MNLPVGLVEAEVHLPFLLPESRALWEREVVRYHIPILDRLQTHFRLVNAALDVAGVYNRIAKAKDLTQHSM